MVEIGAAASSAAWLYLALGHGRFWRVRPVLLPESAVQPSGRVVAVIPARDEAETIARTVESLRDQVAAVIVVDDGSSDGTGELAAAAGAVVIRGAPLAAGWTGKLWALSQGVEHARQFEPDYLLFTDADIVHSASSVRSLVGKAEADHRDLVSVMVRLNCESLAERLLIPAFVFFFFMLYPPEFIASRRRSTAGAAGGCVLIRPEALARAGGIEAIRSELIDDCALARIVKRSGGSLWLGLSDGTKSIRPYPAFADIRRMISRTAYTQLGYSVWLLAGTVLGMGFLYILPLVSATWAGFLAWLIMAAIYAPIATFYGQPVYSGLALPFVALFYLYATVESAVRYWIGKGGAWKGRHQAPAVR